MSATIAALLVGTAAVGGFGAWAGSSSSTEVPTPKEALQQVSKVVDQEEDEPSQPKPSTPPPTPIAEPVPEPVSESVPTEETKEEEKVPEPVPEPAPEAVVQGGGSLKKQDGGFGKPTWAPLNSGDSLQSAMGLTKDQIGSTGSSLLSKWTGAKTAESIQLKLKEIDDQLRVLRADEFTTKSKLDRNITEMKKDPDNLAEGPQADPKNTLRGKYMKEYNTYLTSKTLFDYNSKLISRIVDEKKDQDTEEKSLKDLYKERFPNKAEQFDDPSNKVELFEFIKLRNDLPENLKLKKTKSGKDATADSWWSSLNNKTSGNKDSDPSKLSKYLKDREESYNAYTTAEEKMNSYKDKFEELDASIKELTPKLKNIQKKIKELLDTRELVLVELSNYELPKGLFESFVKQRPIQKPSLLPTGEQRDRIIAQIKDYEQRIKDKKEELDDELDKQLNISSSWKPAENNNDEYGRLLIAIKDLEKRRDNEILKLEGKTIQQKELATSLSLLDKFIEYLKKNKVQGITNFDNKDFKNVFNILTLMSQDTDPLNFIANLDKYYNFFTAGTKTGIAKYDSEVVDKVIIFLLKFNVVVKNPEVVRTIITFGNNFISMIQLSKTNLLSTLGYVTEINDKEELRADILNLSPTARGILQGRSVGMQLFIENLEKTKTFTKGYINLLFKDDKEKLTNLNEVFNKKIHNKIYKIKSPLKDEILAGINKILTDIRTLVSQQGQINLEKLQESKKSLDIYVRRFASMVPNTSERNKQILVKIKKFIEFDISSIIAERRGGAKFKVGNIVTFKNLGQRSGIPPELGNKFTVVKVSQNGNIQLRADNGNTSNNFYDKKIFKLYKPPAGPAAPPQQEPVAQEAQAPEPEAVLAAQPQGNPFEADAEAEEAARLPPVEVPPNHFAQDVEAPEAQQRAFEANPFAADQIELNEQIKEEEYAKFISLLQEIIDVLQTFDLFEKEKQEAAFKEQQAALKEEEKLRKRTAEYEKLNQRRRRIRIQTLVSKPYDTAHQDYFRMPENLRLTPKIEKKLEDERKEEYLLLNPDKKNDIESINENINEMKETEIEEANVIREQQEGERQEEEARNAPLNEARDAFRQQQIEMREEGPAQGNPFGNAPEQQPANGNPFGNAPQQEPVQGNPFGNAPPEQRPANGNPFAGGSSRKNHLTRKQHWTRSKPSRFKTHRIY